MWESTGLGSFRADVDLLLAVAAAPAGWEAWFTALVVAGGFVCLVLERGTPDQVLLGALAVFLVTGVVDPVAGLSGFANPAMLTVGSLFVVAASVRRSGALAFLARVMRPRSTRLIPALARIMLPASALSTFLNNTPIVAFLTPLVRQWGLSVGLRPSRLLIPLSYATILGGMGTLIGTSTNLVVSALLDEAGYAPFAMFELLWVGLPASVVGFVYFAVVGRRLLPEREDPEATDLGGVREFQFDLVVPPRSELVGRSIFRAGLRHLEDAFLAHIERRGELIGPVSPEHTLEEGDLLTFYGDSEVMSRLLQDGNLARATYASGHDPDERDGASIAELPLFEAVVSPESSLVGRTLRESDFRQRFQAVVLGIHRRGERLRGPLGRSRIRPGDLLLVEARPRFDDRWMHSGEFYLVAPLARTHAKVPREAVVVFGLIVAMIGVVAAGLLPMVTAALLAAFAVVLVTRLTMTEARRSVDLSVLLVIAAAFGVGEAIRASGLAAWAGGTIGAWTSSLGPVGVLIAVYLATNLLTEFLTNSVAAALLFPVGLAAATEVGADPRAFGVAIATAASASFATPIGYQTNLMVMGPGGYRYRDYLRIGLPLNLLIMVLAIVVIRIVWL